MSYPRDLDEYDESELVTELCRRRTDQDAGLCDYCHHPAGEPIPIYQRSPEHAPVGGSETCRFPNRHRGLVGRGELFLSDITRVNVARCKRWHPGFPADDNWSLADWSNALCGEAGELANVIKKIRRHESDLRGELDPDEDELRAMAAKEVADVYLYLDLLAFRLGVDKQSAVVAKFDEISKRQGFPERLRP